MRYDSICPITRRIPAARQEAKRHYGVHPYFTRRPYNVVRDYILHYSKEGDVVLDPFGGSGVTAVEAYLENRTGIHNDINPLANFIVESLVHLPDVSAGQAAAAFTHVEEQCRGVLKDMRATTRTPSLPPDILLPPNVPLPKNADVSTYHELFTLGQLRSLAVLKHAIDAIEGPAKSLLMLAWSGTLSRLNRTFISTNGRAESRGGSSIFSIYRYKVARRPVELDPWSVFQNRFRGVMAARRELVDAIEMKRSTKGWRGRFLCFSEDVVDLQRELKGKVDYIFTDPPYGGHISYLDLSCLWNVWLGMLPSGDARDKELIVGGERDFSEEHYTDQLYQSTVATFAMLKNRRWMSVVFQHWNVSYFRSILDAARDSGASLRAAVSQVGDPIWSMHKKKNRESVLAGELILTFFKGRTHGKTAAIMTKSVHLEGMVDEVLSELDHPVLYGEYLFNRIVVEAWRRGIIDELKVSKQEFAALLEERGWHYDQARHLWSRAGRSSDGPIWDEQEFRVADRGRS
ncbi:MAG TPA: DNA methyltransferase [bacterium]|nr:DNA methyltransferase [bacterium]